MRSQEFTKAVEDQRAFFNTNQTRDLNFRLDALKKLRNFIIKNERKIADALFKDFKKSKYETYLSEVGLVIEELNIHIRKLRSWAKPQRTGTPLLLFPASSKIYPEPYGVTLIVAPWNFPFQLMMAPLVGALAAGNCAILKPARYSSATSKIINEIIRKCFNPEYVRVFEGGRDIIQALLCQDFDYVFFTGSQTLGKIVMEECAKNLTPVTLELGGKNPCIVDKDANIELAAKRIAWSKAFNAGQTCVAPDYLFIHKEVKEAFIEGFKKSITEFFGDNLVKNKEYPRIINEMHYKRIIGLLENANIVAGGEQDPRQRFIAPTIVDNIDFESPIMQEEIFGPVLPLIEFEELDEALKYINSQPKALSLYYFSNNGKKQKHVATSTCSGAVSINDIISYFLNPNLPFGGVGASGMGKYHGKSTFDTFTHYKAVFKKSTSFDSPLRYAPYKDKLNKLKNYLK